MRRKARKPNIGNDELNIKIIKYSAIGVVVLAVLVFFLLIYSRNLNEEVKQGTLTSEQLSNILNNENAEKTESASSEMGKTVEESEKELNSKNIVDNSLEQTNSNINSTNQVLTTNKVTPTVSIDSKTNNKNIEDSLGNKEKTSQLEFKKPVEGDIIRDFAVESLIYSETLQEWTTHTGIDIKAEKTMVVKSSEEGIVKSIKNDPRYGLTVIVEHNNGFQTVYSNLLSSEFVVEGEKIESGQSIGTVGNTAAFEIADEPHLHFEIIKDGVEVDPNIYIK